MSCLERAQSTGINDRDTRHELESATDSEFDSEFDISVDNNLNREPPQHVLALLKRKTIQFSTFCEIGQRWEKSTKHIDLMQAIESFRDAVLVPINKYIVIFNMKNGLLTHAQDLSLETATIESIKLPNDVECASLALFCQLNDKIYCFGRSEQQFYKT